MENNKKDNLLEQHIERIKYRTNYRINESPRYRALVNDGEDFDEVPDINPNATQDGQPMPTGQNLRMTEAGDQEDAPKPEGESPIEPDVDDTVGLEDDGIPPETPPEGGEELSGEQGIAPESLEPPEQQVDDIQNDIIKHNIVAMNDIHTQLEALNNTVRGLNSKMDVLNSDVEEVREPTNTEKLMNKTQVSYPYYFNLNDFWKGNWFDNKVSQGGQEVEAGIRELPDGTYIAEFDDLPQKSKIDVQNSFSELNESKTKKKDKLVEQYGEPQENQETSLIDGRSKQSAKNLIYKHVGDLTNGIFRDDAWQNVKKIFDKFGEMGLDWNITDTKYDGSMPPESKVWYFEIRFINNAGKQNTIGGNLTAHGAGSTEDPLDRYDISLVLY